MDVTSSVIWGSLDNMILIWCGHVESVKEERLQKKYPPLVTTRKMQGKKWERGDIHI
jgi:hypothetical protein